MDQKLPIMQPKRRPARKRLSREEKAQRTHANIMAAAYNVVASDGYANAAIARIAAEAGVAQGTFYNYFEDRQDLFDQLLPYQGLRMREAIECEARKVPAGVQRELVRFAAFLDYVAENDGFYRVLYEAEIFSPDAHAEHVGNIVRGYRRSFRRGMEQGWLQNLDAVQLDCLIYQILGIRSYAAMQIHNAGSGAEKLAIRNASLHVYAMMFEGGMANEETEQGPSAG